MDGEKILSTLSDKEKTEFLICGGIAFTRDIWKSLKLNGISEDRIYTEAFF